MTDTPASQVEAPPAKVKVRSTSGKRVILVMLALIALWGGVLSVLVWRTAMRPHHIRVRPPAGEGAPSSGRP